ncbi:hypothetical protein [Barthadenovirus sternae]|nr:hypothetical protein [Tern atadenovirus 1]
MFERHKLCLTSHLYLFELFNSGYDLYFSGRNCNHIGDRRLIFFDYRHKPIIGFYLKKFWNCDSCKIATNYDQYIAASSGFFVQLNRTIVAYSYYG